MSYVPSIPVNLSKWTAVGPSKDHCHHLWRMGPNGYDNWFAVTDDYDTWEFRECVLCGTKQIREFQS